MHTFPPPYGYISLCPFEMSAGDSFLPVSRELLELFLCYGSAENVLHHIKRTQSLP